MAALLFIVVDCGRYNEMKNHFQQNMVMVTNNYLRLIDETMNVLNTFAKASKSYYGKKSGLQLTII